MSFEVLGKSTDKPVEQSTGFQVLGKGYIPDNDKLFLGNIQEFKEGELPVGGFDALRKQRAVNQSTGEQIAKTIGNLPFNIGLGLLEGAGYIAELAIDEEGDYSNALTELAKEYRNPLGETYRENPNEVFDMKDPAWWMENIGGLLESVGEFAITGAGIGGVLSKGAKALSKSLKLKGYLNKSSKLKGYLDKGYLDKGLNAAAQMSTSTTLGYMESAMIGSDLYKKIIAKGGTPEEAAAGAAEAVKMNTGLSSLTNLTGMSVLFKSAKQVNQASKLGLGKIAGESVKDRVSRIKNYIDELKVTQPNKVAFLAQEGALEALEEELNLFSERRGEIAGNIRKDESYTDSFSGAVFTEEGLLSGLLGAAGGIGQSAIINYAPIPTYEDGKIKFKDSADKKLRLEELENNKKYASNLSEFLNIQLKLNEELKKAASEENLNKTEFIKNEIFNNYVKHASNKDQLESVQQSLEEISKLSNEDLSEPIQKEVTEINTQIQNLTEQLKEVEEEESLGIQEQISQLNEEKKAKQEEVNKFRGKSEAILAGYAESLEDNEYKETASKRISQIANYIAKQKEFNKTLNISEESERYGVAQEALKSYIELDYLNENYNKELSYISEILELPYLNNVVTETKSNPKTVIKAKVNAISQLLENPEINDLNEKDIAFLKSKKESLDSDLKSLDDVETRKNINKEDKEYIENSLEDYSQLFYYESKKDQEQKKIDDLKTKKGREKYIDSQIKESKKIEKETLDKVREKYQTFLKRKSEISKSFDIQKDEIKSNLTSNQDKLKIEYIENLNEESDLEQAFSFLEDLKSKNQTFKTQKAQEEVERNKRQREEEKKEEVSESKAEEPDNFTDEDYNNFEGEQLDLGLPIKQQKLTEKEQLDEKIKLLKEERDNKLKEVESKEKIEKDRIKNHVDKIVIYNNKPYTLKKEGVRYILEDDVSILELSANDNTTLTDLQISLNEPKIKYNVEILDENEVKVNNILYAIITDENGNISGLSPSNNLQQIIKNEKLLVAVEIERNKTDFNEIVEEIIEDNLYESAKSSHIELEFVEGVYSKNWNNTVASAIDKLYNNEILDSSEKLALDLWVTDAIIDLTKLYVKNESLIYSNALDNLEIINILLYDGNNKKYERQSTSKNGSSKSTKKRTNIDKKPKRENTKINKKEEISEKDKIIKEYEEKIEKLKRTPLENLIPTTEENLDNEDINSDEIYGDEVITVDQEESIESKKDEIESRRKEKESSFEEAGKNAKNKNDGKILGQWILENAQLGDTIINEDGNGYEVTNIDKNGNVELTAFEINEKGEKEYIQTADGIRLISKNQLKQGDLFEYSYTDLEGNKVVKKYKYNFKDKAELKALEQQSTQYLDIKNESQIKIENAALSLALPSPKEYRATNKGLITVSNTINSEYPEIMMSGELAVGDVLTFKIDTEYNDGVNTYESLLKKEKDENKPNMFVPIAVYRGRDFLHYIHDLDYINESRVQPTVTIGNVSIDNIKRQRDILSELRSNIIENNYTEGEIKMLTGETTISPNVDSEGKYQYQPVNKAFEGEVELGIIRGAGVVSSGSEIEIDNSEDFLQNQGAIVVVLPKSNTGTKAAVKLKVKKNPYFETVLEIIDAYLNTTELTEEFRKEGIDISNRDEVRELVQNYINLNSNLADPDLELSKEIIEDKKQDKYYTAITDGKIYIQSTNKNKSTAIRIEINKNNWEKFKPILRDHLQRSYLNFDQSKLDKQFTLYTVEEGKLKSESLNYTDFIKNNTTTWVKENKLSNGKYSYFDNPNINFEVKQKVITRNDEENKIKIKAENKNENEASNNKGFAKINPNEAIGLRGRRNKKRNVNESPLIQNKKHPLLRMKFQIMDKSDTPIILQGNEDVYKNYNLLTVDGKIKTVLNKTDNQRIIARKWVLSLNQSPYYSFDLRTTPKGDKIFIFPKKDVNLKIFGEYSITKEEIAKIDVEQLSLFDKINFIENKTVENRRKQCL